MLLINQRPLEINAVKDESHPMHLHAKEYEKGLKYLRETYGNSIRFVRPKFPKKTKGIDSKGREVDNLLLPTPPMIIPLTAEVNGRTGLEIWSCALDNPKLLPNGLWELGGRRSIMIKDANITVNLKSQAELAFFLYYKSPFYSSGQLKIDDPVAQAKLEGDKEREALELQTAIYGVLADEAQLKVVAQSCGIAGVDKKHPDAIRKELKSVVMEGEKRKKKDPMAKGLKEFLDELKVTDAVRLRSAIKTAEDNGKIVWSPDGRYKVGERELCKIPVSEIPRRFDFMCNHLGNVANRPKLQDLLRDIINKEYLDKIEDEKTFMWLARSMGLPVEFKKKEAIRESVYETFVTE